MNVIVIYEVYSRQSKVADDVTFDGTVQDVDLICKFSDPSSNYHRVIQITLSIKTMPTMATT